MRTDVDWKTVELQYRAGVMPNKKIAELHGIHEQTLYQHVRENGWTHDLQTRIAEEREAEVAREDAPDGASEDEVVTINAKKQALIVRAERADVRAARRIVKRLMAELEEKDAGGEDFKVKLSERSGIMAKLTPALCMLIDKERLVCGIDGKQTEGGTLQDFLTSLPEPEASAPIVPPEQTVAARVILSDAGADAPATSSAPRDWQH